MKAVVHCWLGALMLAVLAAPAAAAPEHANDAVYATVNGVKVMRQEVDAALYSKFRQRFYHGRADEAQIAALRLDVGQELVERVLLVAEARRRGLEADEAAIGRSVEQQLWRLAEHGVDERQLVALKSQLRLDAEQSQLVDLLKEDAAELAAPSVSVLRAYYEAHLDKFTTPERLNLSVILLKVAPSSTAAVWEAAKKEAAQILVRLSKGADFSELARIHSFDDSAKSGGNLGFVHQGMLSAEAQAAVDGLVPGEVSPAVVLLQGVALFRLEAREDSRVNSFEDVKVRVQALWAREERQQRWELLLGELRGKARIIINDESE